IPTRLKTTHPYLSTVFSIDYEPRMGQGWQRMEVPSLALFHGLGHNLFAPIRAPHLRGTECDVKHLRCPLRCCACGKQFVSLGLLVHLGDVLPTDPITWTE